MTIQIRHVNEKYNYVFTENSQYYMFYILEMKERYVLEWIIIGSW